MPEDFPISYPEVICTTQIYHPNIDPTCEDSNNVCVSLFDEWDPNFGIRDVIQGLLFLFYNPNVDDPLSTYFGDPLSDEEFEANVRASLRGEEVDVYDFPWNYYGSDPEMLKYKPDARPDKTETTESNAVSEEQSAEKEKNDESTENTTTSNAENAETGANVNANSEDYNSRNLADFYKDDKEIQKAIDAGNEMVNTDTEAKDLTVILEKVTELMVQYPDDDYNEEEGEKKEQEVNNNEERNSEPDAANLERTQEQNSNRTESDINNTENIPIGATNNDVNGEDETQAANNDVTAAGLTVQRQTSKLERQSSIKETLTGCADNLSSTVTFFQFPDAIRTCQLDTPECDFIMNLFATACLYVYKAFVK